MIINITYIYNGKIILRKTKKKGLIVSQILQD